jgi:hypothetical protein
MLRKAGRVDLRAVVRMCPGATEPDLQDAIRYLLRRLITRPAGSAMHITEAGLRHLAR